MRLFLKCNKGGNAMKKILSFIFVLTILCCVPCSFSAAQEEIEKSDSITIYFLCPDDFIYTEPGEEEDNDILLIVYYDEYRRKIESNMTYVGNGVYKAEISDADEIYEIRIKDWHEKSDDRAACYIRSYKELPEFGLSSFAELDGKLLYGLNANKARDRFQWDVTRWYYGGKLCDYEDWPQEGFIDGSYLVGDVNSDGELNIRDATAIGLYLAGLSSPSQKEINTADFDGNSKVNVKDATEIQKKLAGLSYTSRREMYPVVYYTSTPDETEPLDITVRRNNRYGSDELTLMDSSNRDVSEYTTIINSEEEFRSIFGSSVDEYDEEFFSTKSLVYLYRYYESVSSFFDVNEMYFSDDILYLYTTYRYPFPDNFYPYSDSYLPSPGNYDEWDSTPAFHNIFTEVDKADIEGVKGIIIYDHIEFYY